MAILVELLRVVLALLIVASAAVIVCSDINKFSSLPSIMSSFFYREKEYSRPADLLMILIYLTTIAGKITIVYLLFWLMLLAWPY